MPRRVVSTESILDAARDAVAAGGLRAATLEAIAAASAVPVGSVYYRFGSVPELLARMWLRSVQRSHAAVERAMNGRELGIEAAVAVALGLYDFCLSRREDAAVLAAVRATDLLDDSLPAPLVGELLAVNQPVEPLIAALARACLDRADRAGRDAILLAAVDLPYGAAGRYLAMAGSPPRERRSALEAAVRGALAESRAALRNRRAVRG